MKRLTDYQFLAGLQRKAPACCLPSPFLYDWLWPRPAGAGTERLLVCHLQGRLHICIGTGQRKEVLDAAQPLTTCANLG